MGIIMPKKRSKRVSPKSLSAKTAPALVENMAAANRPSGTMTSSSWKKYLIIIILVLLAALVYKYKNLFVVASVNGKPISRLDLEKELNTKYGSQTLDNLISEQIILDGANKKGVTVSANDINKKIIDIENRLHGQAALNQALAAQGLSMDDFRKQVEIQLTINKLFDKEASVSDKEISDYISQNQSSLSSTDPAQLKSEALAALQQQKVGDLFDKWFAQEKKQAQVVKF